MDASERSVATAVLCLAALGLLAYAFASPWFGYDFSSGRRTPPGGLHDPADLQAEHRHADVRPFRAGGDEAPSDAAGAGRLADALGAALAAAAVCLALLALGQLRGPARLLPRPAALALAAAAALALLAALAAAWLLLPATFAGQGVDGPFTSFVDDRGYTRTALGPGWAAALAAVPLALAAFATQYQAGAGDPAAVEAAAGRAA